MGSSSTSEGDYAAFEEKVSRTVYVDNLSPLVTESILRTALDQFGTVKNVQFIPNYLIPENIPSCALVEMETRKEARAVVSTLSESPFMISGMPRPVRAFPANPDMFDDRPPKPGRKISFQWLEPSDKDFGTATKVKSLVRKHTAQDLALHRLLLEEEEKLSKRQAEALKASYKKYDMMDSIAADGTARRLAHHYNMNFAED